jgi:hypothetical protein
VESASSLLPQSSFTPDEKVGGEAAQQAFMALIQAIACK